MTTAGMGRSLLLAMAIGLTPVALSYGAAPGASLPWLFGVDAPDATTRHLFRAVMGLYFAMIVFWTMGALRPALRRPALLNLFLFTLGIGLGRVLSLILDGPPGPLLIGYMLAEFALAAGAAWLLLRDPVTLTETRP